VLNFVLVNSKFPWIFSPGDTPTFPATFEVSPLKLTDVPAFTAKPVQSPRFLKVDSGHFSTAADLFFSAVVGRRVSDPLSKTMAVEANALPMSSELLPKLT
jgi:hypothetical protein